MELKEFVAQTLQQIVEGVKEAQNSVSQLGATINPNGAFPNQRGDVIHIIAGEPSSTRTVQQVEFDIALGETGGSSAGGRIGVIFANIGFAGGSKTETGTSAMNRVKFSVPVVLPPACA